MGLFGIPDPERRDPKLPPVGPPDVRMPVSGLFRSRRPLNPLLAAQGAPKAGAVQEGPGGIRGLINLLATGSRAGNDQALMQAGLSMLAGASRPWGTFGESLARGLMHGQQVGAQARAREEAQRQVRRVLGDPGIRQRIPLHQLAVLRSLPPEQALEAVQELLTQDPVAVAEGTDLVDPSTGRPVYSNDVSPDSSPLPGNLRGLATLMGIDPANATAEERRELLTRWEEMQRTPRTTVSFQPEDATQRAMVELEKGALQDARESANVARDQMGRTVVLRGLLREGMTTGRLEEATMALRGYAESLGLANADQLGQQQVFAAISNDMAFDLTKKLKGQISNHELNLLKQTVPNLAFTEEGNELLLEIMRRKAEFDMNYAAEAERYVAERGSLIGLTQHMAEWGRENFSIEDLAPEAPF